MADAQRCEKCALDEERAARSPNPHLDAAYRLYAAGGMTLASFSATVRREVQREEAA